MKKAKRELITYSVCCVLYLICFGIDIYLAISSDKYIYFLPAATIAIAFWANVINAVKCRKRIKSQEQSQNMSTNG